MPKQQAATHIAASDASVVADLQIGRLGLLRAFCRGGFRPPSLVSLCSGRFFALSVEGPKRAPFVSDIIRISRITNRAT
jgi:hypothetical protein